MNPNSRIVIRQRVRRSHARSDLVRILRGGMEAVVLALAAITPWAFGGVDPVYELVIGAALALLLVLWAAVAIASDRLTIARCPVTLVLALLFLAGLVQLVPLPSTVLGVVSPGAAGIRARIYPEKPEQLATDVQAVGGPAWPTISVYPHATRTDLFRWLGVLVLFVVVRNQVASTDSLWRLSLVLLANGCLLAVFGLFQVFSKTARAQGSGEPLIYWAYRAGGSFGPFINRGHFAAYMNLCIALGVGLLFWLGPTEQDRKQRYMVKPLAASEQQEVFGWLLSPFTVLHSPAQLWTLVGVALMAASVICSVSRGGVASLFIALIATACLRLQWPIRPRRLDVLLVPILLIVGLFAWVGFRPLESRLVSLVTDPSAAGATRWPLWSGLIRLAPRFWLFGSGYGTLGYVEPLNRGGATFDDPAMFVEHAHNDYLEALIEGGVVRALLTLLLVGLVFSAGFRAMRRYAGRSPSALAVGVMAGFLAIALHSAVDFSLTTPAVAILATVVVAHLMALNRADPTRVTAEDHVHVNSAYLVPVTRIAVAATAVMLGGLLVVHFWQADQVHRLKLAAFERKKSVSHEVLRQYLTAAEAIDPDDAELQCDLGQEVLDAGKEEAERPANHLKAPAGPIWLAVGAGSAASAAAGVILWWHDPSLLGPVRPEKKAEIFREFVVPGLQHFAQARRLCPLLAKPQMRFAAHARELAAADRPIDYWKRALYLAPFDFDLWFFAGLQRIQDGKPDAAWEAWRRSLQLTPPRPTSDQAARIRNHLSMIVAEAKSQFGPEPRRIGEKLLTEVLPDRPDELITTAYLVDPTLAANGPARPLIDQALKDMPDRAEGLTPEQYHVKAVLLTKIGDTDAAIRAYEKALPPYSNQVGWRVEFVKLLMDERRWKEAEEQIFLLRSRDKENAEYLKLKEEVERERKIDLPIK